MERVLGELRQGRKTGHWMWFVFPQIAGLGWSAMAQLYAIESLEEAVGYLRHPVLGARLRECTALVSAVQGKSAFEILGTPDDLKFRSCMTLFGAADSEEPLFQTALAKYFGGVADEGTMGLLNRRQG